MTLQWEDAGTEDPGDQNADSRIGAHSYWSLGPDVGAIRTAWTVELIWRGADLEEIPEEGTALGMFPTEQAAKDGAQAYEDQHAGEDR